MKAQTNLGIVVIIFIFFIGCTPHISSELKQFQKVLGKGWECYTTPDEFKKAGIILERTSGNKYFVDADYRNRSKVGESAIGSTTFRMNSTGKGVFNIFKFLSFIDSTKIIANSDHTTTLDVSYDGTQKNIIQGITLDSIISDMKVRHLNPSSHYFIIRESQSATGINISVDKNFIDSLGISAEIALVGSIHPELGGNGANKYKLNKTYNKPIGICSLMYELTIENGFDGNNNISIGDQRYLPSDAKIIKRHE